MRPEFLNEIIDAALTLVLVLHAAKFVIVEIADLWIKIRVLRVAVEDAGSPASSLSEHLHLSQ